MNVMLVSLTSLFFFLFLIRCVIYSVLQRNTFLIIPELYKQVKCCVWSL